MRNSTSQRDVTVYTGRKTDRPLQSPQRLPPHHKPGSPSIRRMSCSADIHNQAAVGSYRNRLRHRRMTTNKADPVYICISTRTFTPETRSIIRVNVFRSTVLRRETCRWVRGTVRTNDNSCATGAVAGQSKREGLVEDFEPARASREAAVVMMRVVWNRVAQCGRCASSD